MKTTETDQLVCPYPGLRSFTEEEALYFKGRDVQIGQVCELLQENRFLMLTGASGEGKSSLIYAGLIPNARAGFFRAQFTNWIIADFRPERSPLANMTRATAGALGIDERTVATELSRGYSSLIDLYVSSDFFLDEHELAFAALSPEEKKARKRGAANLLLIVDQFEEFFTNPENFLNDAPSAESQIVVNLVLETARIALKRSLPVYVVCTMRSDFIGQCVAFRGLPEYIGFSQFFVPRLKRRDFKQVIEEPAILSGNRISQRLVERLVFDLAEGVDQLPVLQHALSQIWLAAENGTQEMDLIHYAMVGGMQADELPDSDRSTFEAWLGSQPEFRKKYYEACGLHKVIEFHANTLYESSWSTYAQRYPDTPLTARDTKRVIAMTFACLTKIDNSRAVRNRMTLAEITSIVNEPHLTAEIIGAVLAPFREESNSFIRPYKTADPATHVISPDTPLDITHEALIRNWNKLNDWATREFDFYVTWLDFRKQLTRWLDSGRKSSFLLPIGPLTYFESWYERCRPNAGWIMRYLDSDETAEARKASATRLLDDARQYLRRSATKVIVSRTFMKYGTRKVATALAIALMIVLSGFYWRDANRKRNENVIDLTMRNASTLIASEDVSAGAKGTYLLMRERYQPGTLVPSLRAMDAPQRRIAIALDAYQTLLTYDNHFNLPIKSELSGFLYDELTAMAANPADYRFLLRSVNEYLYRLSYDNYYNPTNAYLYRCNTMRAILFDLVLRFFSDSSLYVPGVSTEINNAVHKWLTLGSRPSADSVTRMLSAISPFTAGGETAFNIYYPKGTFEPDGNRALDYSGGYHTVASLYGASGDAAMVIRCFEKLQDLQEYFTGRLLNNYNNVIGFLHQFGHIEARDLVVSWISRRFPANTGAAIYKNILNRSGYLSRMYFMNFTGASRSHRGYLHENLFFSAREDFRSIASHYRMLLAQIPDEAERNFSLAMHYKRLAMFEHKYAFDRGLPVDTTYLDGLLDDAWKHFALVEASYLDRKTTPPIPYYSDGIRQPSISNRHLFIYPDYMDGWFSRTYHSDLHFRYMNRNGLLDRHFNSEDDLRYIHFWLAKAHEVDPDPRGISYGNAFILPDRTLADVAGFLKRKGSDANLAYLMLANRSFDRADTVAGKKYLAGIELSTLNRASDRFEYLEKSYFLNQVKDLCANLVRFGFRNEALRLIDTFREEHEKAFAFLFICEKLYKNSYDPASFEWLDSALVRMKTQDFSSIRGELDYRFKVVRLLGEIGGESLNLISGETVRDLPENQKFRGIASQVSGIASEGNYYEAMTAMPSTLTENQELACYYTLLREACIAKERSEPFSAWQSMDRYFDWNLQYIYYVPF